MSSSTFSQMLMGGDLNGNGMGDAGGVPGGVSSNGTEGLLNSSTGMFGAYSKSPFTQHFLDDIGLDEDDFMASKFDLFIPETYDPALFDSYEYLSSKAFLFMDCPSRNYLIQGELLKFFVIVRPPEASKKRFKQQQLQYKIQQQYNMQQRLLQDTNTPPPVKLNIINEDNQTINEPSSSAINSSADQLNDNKITVLQPSPSSSHNLSFEVQFRQTNEYEKAIKELPQGTPVHNVKNVNNIFDYYPKHTFVPTEMKNDHISSSKVTTQYLRTNSTNNNNSSNNVPLNSQKFLGDIIEFSSPFVFKDIALSQKPNFFRLSNGDLVYPVQVPVNILRQHEEKSISMIINIQRPQSHMSTGKYYSNNNNKLTQLILNVNDTTGSILNNPTMSQTPAASLTSVQQQYPTSSLISGLSSSSTAMKLIRAKTRTVNKSFTLSHPIIARVVSSELVKIGNGSYANINIENGHPSLNTQIHDIEFYLSHTQILGPVTVNGVVQRVGGIPKYHQPDPPIKISDHYTLKSLTRHELPITLAPTNQYSFVVSIEPTTTTSIRPPTDRYHTRCNITWSLPCSAGRILSLYELKAQPPFTTDLMVSADNPSPVPPQAKFKINVTVSNLSRTAKNLTIHFPTHALKQSVGAEPPSSALSPLTISSSQAVPRPGSMPLPPLSSSDLSQSLGSSTGSAIGSAIETTSNIDMISPKFQEMGTKSLMSFEEQQRNSVQLLCLEKSIHVGLLHPNISKSVSVEFFPLHPGNFEISNILISDSIEMKSYSLKEPIQISCV